MQISHLNVTSLKSLRCLKISTFSSSEFLTWLRKPSVSPSRISSIQTWGRLPLWFYYLFLLRSLRSWSTLALVGDDSCLWANSQFCFLFRLFVNDLGASTIFVLLAPFFGAACVLFCNWAPDDPLEEPPFFPRTPLLGGKGWPCCTIVGTAGFDFYLRPLSSFCELL